MLLSANVSKTSEDYNKSREKSPRGNRKYISSFLAFAPANDPKVIAKATPKFTEEEQMLEEVIDKCSKIILFVQ